MALHNLKTVFILSAQMYIPFWTICSNFGHR